MKTLLSLIIAFGILIGGFFYESYFVNKQFNEFSNSVTAMISKTDNLTITKLDATNLVEFWKEKKQRLHVFIPHNEIKEVELWLYEVITYAEEKNYEECKAKLVVVNNMLKSIPNIFMFKLENIL